MCEYDLAAWVKRARTSAGLTQEDVALSLGMTKGNISAMENRNGKPTFDAMLKIAKRCNYPLPYQEHDDTNLEENILTINSFELGKHQSKELINPEFPTYIQSINVSTQKINELFNLSSLDGIKLMSPDGDSMEPTIPKKSVVFIDTLCKNFMGDGVYLFIYNNEYYIKRLQRIPVKKYLAISDNTKYREFEIHLDEEIELIATAVIKPRGSFTIQQKR